MMKKEPRQYRLSADEERIANKPKTRWPFFVDINGEQHEATWSEEWDWVYTRWDGADEESEDETWERPLD